MSKNLHLYIVLLLAFCSSCKEQNKAAVAKEDFKHETKGAILSYGPSSVTRAVIQDKKGNIWIASWEGVFRYDGQVSTGQAKSFTNITSQVSSARFFSVLEDRKGNLWFGSVGSGVYYYDGRSFQNFTTRDGLISNGIVCIYEDKLGNIWFGGNGGVSRYDAGLNGGGGQAMSFRNYIINGGVMKEDISGTSVPDIGPPNEVNSIIEDKTGKFWFGTRGNTFIYDARLNDGVGQGKTFVVLTNNGKPFINVRCIIEDKKGNIWLGGNDGLWRYDGSTFTNLMRKFGGFIYEDGNGNIWTTSETPEGNALIRYDEKSLVDKEPTVTEIKSKEYIFGMLEARDGSIWFGAADGVYRYRGKIVTDFKNKPVEE